MDIEHRYVIFKRFAVMLFKYFPPERVDVLSNLKIRFTQPSSLNDPFERDKLIDVSRARLQAKLLLQEEVEKFEKEFPEMTPEERAQFALVKNQCHAEIESSITPKSLGDGLMELLDPSIGILSLGRNKQVELMWSHYTASYSGFVIAFDEANSFFSAPTMDGEKSAPKQVYYSSNRAPVDYNAENWYEQLLCQKSLSWAYEEEVRCFRLFKSEDIPSLRDNFGNPVYLIDFPANMITSIYVGYRANSETRNKVINFAQNQSQRCDVFEASPCADSFGVVFKLIFENKCDD